MRTERCRGPALLIALLLAGQAHGQAWMREYDRGLKAVEAADWAEAEARFAAAAREDGTAQERRRFQGVVTRPYVPYYYAGLAAFRQGNCEKAVQYWSHAATDAVLARLAELRAEQQRGLDTCRSRLAQAAPASTPPTAPPASTATAAMQLASTPATPPVTPATTPATAPPSGSTRPGAPASTPATASTASTAPASTPATPPQTPAVSPAAAGKAPAMLRSTLDAYLAGRYSEVRRIDASTAPDARARAQLHLLRAAAAFTVAQSEGGGEAALEDARREVRAARAAQAGLTPDAVLFSPRFRAFWQQTR